MANQNIKVLALDLDGTLTKRPKGDHPPHPGRPGCRPGPGGHHRAGFRPPHGGSPARGPGAGLGQPGRAGAILAYNGGAIVDCAPGGRVLWQQVLPAPMVPALCRFAASQNVAIVTYNDEGIVTERPEDPWAQREGFTNKLPMVQVDDLPAYVNYPVNKMLINP